MGIVNTIVSFLTMKGSDKRVREDENKVESDITVEPGNLEEQEKDDEETEVVPVVEEAPEPVEEKEPHETELVWNSEFLTSMEQGRVGLTTSLDDVALKASRWGLIRSNLGKPKGTPKNIELPKVSLSGNQIWVHIGNKLIKYPNFRY